MNEHRSETLAVAGRAHLPRENAFRIGSFQAFRAWCDLRRLRSLPADPSTVALLVEEFLPYLGVHGVRPLLRAIRRAHLIVGHADPTSGALDRNGAMRPKKKKLIRNFQLPNGGDDEEDA
ncbi:MAG TPA: hypothetical protein VFO25_08020 [Candidatus Eremiobacteraceae bacterium]|nr:hypothetical protein [Candidatus Eremiobacteraceae bacterium]